MQRMEARPEMQPPYMNAVQNKQDEIPSLMTESEKAMKYNEMMNDIIAYKKQLQPQVVLQPPVSKHFQHSQHSKHPARGISSDHIANGSKETESFNTTRYSGPCQYTSTQLFCCQQQ